MCKYFYVRCVMKKLHKKLQKQEGTLVAYACSCSCSCFGEFCYCGDKKGIIAPPQAPYEHTHEVQGEGMRFKSDSSSYFTRSLV